MADRGKEKESAFASLTLDGVTVIPVRGLKGIAGLACVDGRNGIECAPVTVRGARAGCSLRSAGVECVSAGGGVPVRELAGFKVDGSGGLACSQTRRGVKCVEASASQVAAAADVRGLACVSNGEGLECVSVQAFRGGAGLQFGLTGGKGGRLSRAVKGERLRGLACVQSTEGLECQALFGDAEAAPIEVGLRGLGCARGGAGIECIAVQSFLDGAGVRCDQGLACSTIPNALTAG